MKKIAIVDPSSYALPYDYHYIKALSGSYIIDFYCSSSRFNESYLTDIEKLPNVTVKKYSISNVNRILGLIGLIRMYSMIVLSNRYYTSINIQWSVLKIIDLLLYSLVKNKLVFTFHNVKPHKLNKSSSIFDFLIYKISKKVIFVSRYTMDEFLKVHSLRGKKSFLLNHGCMPLVDSKKNIYSKSVKHQGSLKAVFWGNIKEYKGLGFLVDSLDKLTANGIDLEVYGKFDIDQKKYHEKLVSKGCVSINDYLNLDYVANILTRPDVLVVLPYKNASQSGVMYNLLAHNIPFIATKTGEAYRFLVEHGLEGMSFEYGNSESLIQAFNYFSINKDFVISKLIEVNHNYNWKYDNESLTKIFG